MLAYQAVHGLYRCTAVADVRRVFAEVVCGVGIYENFFGQTYANKNKNYEYLYTDIIIWQILTPLGR